MRAIGHVPSERQAAIFSDYLVVQGIGNEVEADKHGWAIWVHSEDEMGRARGLLDKYLADPGAPVYQQHAQQAQAVKERRRREAEAAEQRHFHRRQLFPTRSGLGAAPLTMSLIALSVLVGILSRLGQSGGVLQWLLISTIPGTSLPEVMHGQVWRLITPIVVHFGILHIAFNMLWLYDLGTTIETRMGTARLALLVLGLGLLSNLGQYFVSGPFFGGMSGVVYGLLGYVWMKGKFDPGSGLYLHPQTVTFMIIWFFLGVSGILGNIANVAHGVGGLAGVAWGYASSQMGQRGRRF